MRWRPHPEIREWESSVDELLAGQQQGRYEEIGTYWVLVTARRLGASEESRSTPASTIEIHGNLQEELNQAAQEIISYFGFGPES